jgi:hypothetical protein
MVYTIKVSVITVGILQRQFKSFEGFLRNVWGNLLSVMKDGSQLHTMKVSVITVGILHR